MKRMFLIIAALAICATSFAQLATTLVVNATPPGTLIDWSTKKETLTYLVVNQTGALRRAVIKAELKTTDGTVAASANLAKAPIINFANGTTVLSAADAIPLDVMVFNGKFKSTLEKTGKLPADNYQLCLQLVNPGDFIPVSEQRCRNFTIAAFQLPIPVMPANESILDIEKVKAAITFRWTPVAPMPGQPVTYRVTVFEVLPGQTSMQALRSNQPLLTKDIIGTTQYIWQPQLGLTICCKDGDVTGDEKNINKTDQDTIAQKNINTSEAGVGTGKDKMQKEADAYVFIWTIQTFDQLGRPFGDGNINGDGISEPVIFFIDRRPVNLRKSGPPSRTNYLNNMKGKRN
jgi:hypothetical protein